VTSAPVRCKTGPTRGNPHKEITGCIKTKKKKKKEGVSKKNYNNWGWSGRTPEEKAHNVEKSRQISRVTKGKMILE